MFTYPLIGNYGVSSKDYESEGIKTEGVVVRGTCFQPSNWQSEKSLSDFLLEFEKPGIYGVDTRALTKKIRTRGTMKAILQTYTDPDQLNLENLKREVREQKSISELDLVERVGTTQIKEIKSNQGKYNLVLVDCGVKKSIVENLLKWGLNLIIVPYNTLAEEILSYKPDAVLISNGPGDPIRAEQTISTVKKLINKTILYGICFGHQIIALALGAKTYKLKFVHRGLNQPVKDLESGRVFISTQNHGFAVGSESLKKTGLEITQINLNDQTIEGLRHKELPIKTVQYHPEAGPGPHDTFFFFDSLIADIKHIKTD